MHTSTYLALLGAALTATVTAQGGIPSAQGHSTGGPPANVAATATQTIASNEIPPIQGLTTTSAAGGTTTTSSSSMSTTSMIGSSAAGSAAQSIPFGSTLSNGAYVCNPAHFYASTLSCDGSNATPTLVTLSGTSIGGGAAPTATTTGALTAAVGPALYFSTAANGSVVQYTTYTPTASAWVSTWTGAAAAKVVPLAGALIAGAVAFIA